MDPANGYEAHAAAYMQRRDRSTGVDVVREWAGAFAPGTPVLELGCGHGVVSQALVDAGLDLYAIDASPTLLDAFRRRFPAAHTECASAEHSTYFGRSFHGVIAWGLIFLLPVEAQHEVLARACRVLRPGGRFLFTAPREARVWIDVLTEQESRSLGAGEYESLLRESGCDVTDGRTDAGGYHYFFARRDYPTRGKEHQVA